MTNLERKLLDALKMCLNYVEHDQATRGKALSDLEWDKAVEAFRKSGISYIDIGRSYVPKAFVNLTEARALIKFAESGPTREEVVKDLAAWFPIIKGNFDGVNVEYEERIDATEDLLKRCGVEI